MNRLPLQVHHVQRQRHASAFSVGSAGGWSVGGSVSVGLASEEASDDEDDHHHQRHLLGTASRDTSDPRDLEDMDEEDADADVDDDVTDDMDDMDDDVSLPLGADSALDLVRPPPHRHQPTQV